MPNLVLSGNNISNNNNIRHVHLKTLPPRSPQIDKSKTNKFDTVAKSKSSTILINNSQNDLKHDKHVQERVLLDQSTSFLNNNNNKNETLLSIDENKITKRNEKLIEEDLKQIKELNQREGVISKQSFLSKTETELNRFSRNSNMSEVKTFNFISKLK